MWESPRDATPLDLTAPLEGNSVSALGKWINGRPFSLKRKKKNCCLKYKNSLGLGKLHILFIGLRGWWLEQEISCPGTLLLLLALFASLSIFILKLSRALVGDMERPVQVCWGCLQGSYRLKFRLFSGAVWDVNCGLLIFVHSGEVPASLQTTGFQDSCSSGWEDFVGLLSVDTYSAGIGWPNESVPTQECI